MTKNHVGSARAFSHVDNHAEMSCAQLQHMLVQMGHMSNIPPAERNIPQPGPCQPRASWPGHQ